MFRIAFLALAALALIPAPAVAKLSPAETRMIQTVDAEQERTLAMLEKWVNQNSGTLNAEGVSKVGEMLRSELEPIGFKVEWIDMSAAGRSGQDRRASRQARPQTPRPKRVGEVRRAGAGASREAWPPAVCRRDVA